MCVMTESAIVWISKCLNQQTSFQSQQMAGVAKISKCLSQQMSRPSQQMSNQQMSVSKCPVSKWKISKVPDTKYLSLTVADSLWPFDPLPLNSLQTNAVVLFLLPFQQKPAWWVATGRSRRLRLPPPLLRSRFNPDQPGFPFPPTLGPTEVEEEWVTPWQQLGWLAGHRRQEEVTSSTASCQPRQLGEADQQLATGVVDSKLVRTYSFHSSC